MTQFVYLATRNDGEMVKLGWSRDPAAAVRQLGYSSPVGFRLSGGFPGGQETVRAICDEWAHLTATTCGRRGRWFRPSIVRRVRDLYRDEWVRGSDFLITDEMNRLKWQRKLAREYGPDAIIRVSLAVSTNHELSEVRWKDSDGRRSLRKPLGDMDWDVRIRKRITINGRTMPGASIAYRRPDNWSWFFLAGGETGPARRFELYVLADDPSIRRNPTRPFIGFSIPGWRLDRQEGNRYKPGPAGPIRFSKELRLADLPSQQNLDNGFCVV